MFYGYLQWHAIYHTWHITSNLEIGQSIVGSGLTYLGNTPITFIMIIILLPPSPSFIKAVFTLKFHIHPDFCFFNKEKLVDNLILQLGYPLHNHAAHDNFP